MLLPRNLYKTIMESMRDIEACLGAIGPKLYHMGFG